MIAQELKRVLSTFSNRPEDIDLSRDEIVIQVQNELISFRTSQRGGQIYVIEDNQESMAEEWIAKRLANLPLLARRILDCVENTEHFVPPSGQLVDEIERNPEDKEVPVENVIVRATNLLDKSSGISTLVLYLTSDAGEGKTTIINQMARSQADKYCRNQTDWLLLPIPLGGRPFLRLDDIVVGSIANRYRFRGLYYESFLELVKYGFIVPALDGFEEMFVVGSSGEAVSSLGNLIQNLSSTGRLLVAARKAYFEIRDFESQARLFDTMQRTSASFSRLKIDRWNRDQFIMYWGKRALPNGPQVYDTLRCKFGQEAHPLLTRAVLVKKLADVAEDSGRFDSLVERISGKSATYFSDLVDSIIEREVEEKWVERSEEGVRRPLLSLRQHHELLSQVAIEMANESSALISHDALQLVTEYFCEITGLAPEASRQVINRIYDHPLLVKPDVSGRRYSFDHDEFREYFLGEGLGDLLIADKNTDVRMILRKVILSSGAIDACRNVLKEKKPILQEIVGALQNVANTESAASYARENCGQLIVKIIQDGALKGLIISEVSLPPGVFVGGVYEHFEFKKCFFRMATFDKCTLRSCTFKECEFQLIELREDMTIQECRMVDCAVFSLLLHGSDAPIFSPEDIRGRLKQIGFDIEEKQEREIPVEEEKKAGEDEDLLLLTRALRAFHRSTGVNDNIFRVRLGKKGQVFLDRILPEALDANVLKEEPYLGSGHQRRFRLGVPMSTINDAFRRSGGRYENFLEQIRKKTS